MVDLTKHILIPIEENYYKRRILIGIFLLHNFMNCLVTYFNHFKVLRVKEAAISFEEVV